MVLLDKRKAAETLGIGSATVNRLMKSGALPYRKIGALVRFSDSDIEEFLNNAKVRNQAGAG